MERRWWEAKKSCVGGGLAPIQYRRLEHTIVRHLWNGYGVDGLRCFGRHRRVLRPGRRRRVRDCDGYGALVGHGAVGSSRGRGRGGHGPSRRALIRGVHDHDGGGDGRAIHVRVAIGETGGDDVARGVRRGGGFGRGDCGGGVLLDRRACVKGKWKRRNARVGSVDLEWVGWGGLGGAPFGPDDVRLRAASAPEGRGRRTQRETRWPVIYETWRPVATVASSVSVERHH